VSKKKIHQTSVGKSARMATPANEDIPKGLSVQALPTLPSATYLMPASTGIGFTDIKVLPVGATEFFLSTISLRWIRLPVAKAREPWTNLSRSVLNTLILPCAANRYRPPVQSASFAQPGQKRATRLINLRSLLAYVQLQAEKTAVDAAAKKALRGKARHKKAKEVRSRIPKKSGSTPK
jgi:hypothetical protein